MYVGVQHIDIVNKTWSLQNGTSCCKEQLNFELESAKKIE